WLSWACPAWRGRGGAAGRSAAPGSNLPRPTGALLTIGESPQVLGAEEPVLRGPRLGDGPGELEHTGRALAELQERPAGPREQRADELAQVGLVADGRDSAPRVLTREPADDPLHARARCELRNPLHPDIVVRRRQDLGGLEGALERAGSQKVDLRHQLPQ